MNWMDSTSVRQQAVRPLLGLEPHQHCTITANNEGAFDQSTIGGESVQGLGIRHGLDRCSAQGAVALSTGVEQRTPFAELSESSIGVDDTNVLVAGDTASFTAGRDIYVGARAGIFASDNGFLYVKGGYTNQKFDLDYTAPGVALSDSSNADGFRVGAGGEFRLADNLTARVEYRYSNYGELEFDGTALGVGSRTVRTRIE